MNWMVAESNLVHGGGGCEHDEDEEEAAKFAEFQRRKRAAAAQAGKVATPQGKHSDASAAMAAEHSKLREQEQQRRTHRIEQRKKEDAEGVQLLGQHFGLPGDVSNDILSAVGDLAERPVFEYNRTQRAATEAEHERREKFRSGVLSREKRADGYMSELAAGASEQRWDDLQAVSAHDVNALNSANSRVHAKDDQQFVLMYR